MIEIYEVDKTWKKLVVSTYAMLLQCTSAVSKIVVSTSSPSSRRSSGLMASFWVRRPKPNQIKLCTDDS